MRHPALPTIFQSGWMSLKTRHLNMAAPRRRLPLLLVGLASLFVSLRAEAIPAFARKYDASCHTCHDRAYPELNSFGRLFKENGYQYPKGAEQRYRDRTMLSPGTILERIALWRELPIALRAQGAIEVPVDGMASNRGIVNLRLLENFYVIAGGSLFKNISVIISANVAPNPGLHHAAIGLHNLFFGEHHLNLRVGQLLLFDFIHPEHRSVTRMGNLGATTRVGLNPTALDTSHLGIEIFGRFFKQRLFYQFAVVQGARGLDGISDLDSGKDLFGNLQLVFHDRQMIGTFAYWGNTQITDRARSVEVRFTDPLVIVGGNLELHLGRFTLFGYALYGRHENPNGNHKPIAYVGTRAEISATILRDLMAQVRFDGVFSREDPTLEKIFVTGHVSYLLLTNIRLSLELQVNLKVLNQSTAFLLWDVTL